MQAHHAPVRGFGQRLQGQQLLRVRQRIGPVARVLGHLRQLDQRGVDAVAAAAALLLQPGGELAAGHRRSLAEHAVGVFEVVRDALGQGQRGAADHGLEAERLAQRKEALAQRVARGVGIAVGPQQRGQTRARRRAFQGQPGQQRGVARGELNTAAVGAEKAGRGGEMKLHRKRS